MKVLDFNIYMDGGTAKVVTDEGTYFIDGRLFSKSVGELYEDYPTSGNQYLIPHSDELKSKIANALKNYDNPFYSIMIKELIMMYNVE